MESTVAVTLVAMVASDHVSHYLGGYPDRVLAMIHELYGAATGKMVRSDAELIALARRWIICDWFRVGLIAVGFLASVRAISLPITAQKSSTV